MKNLIVFACKGNIHRSAVAEVCLRQEIEKKGLNDEFEVISRGIQGTAGTKPTKHKNLMGYDPEWSLSGPILKDLQVDISKHQSTPIDREITERASLIFAMDQKVLIEASNSLVNQFPEHRNKMRLLSELEGKKEDIPDCDGSSDVELHRYVNSMIVRIIREKADMIIASARQLAQGVD